MPTRRLPNPLESIESLMDGMRKLQSDAERTLQQEAAKPADGAAAATRPESRRASGVENDRSRSLLRISIERQLGDGLARILERLDLPSRREIEALSRRIARLEEALGTRTQRRRSTP